jgi:hypothetical protein
MSPSRLRLLRALARLARPWAAALGIALPSGCTWHHSKQALLTQTPADAKPPAADARFVTEEDSGLSIFGMFVLAEPDHYAVLLERMRRDHRCARLLYPQLDFYTDHWILIAFPISRVTSLCEPEAPPAPPSPAPPAKREASSPIPPPVADPLSE